MMRTPHFSDVPNAQLDSGLLASNLLEKSMVRINKSHLRLNNELRYVVSQDVLNSVLGAEFKGA
jgi:hypothetical protein